MLRYKKLLQSVKNACEKISGMHKKQQIAWRFKNKDLLMHNYTTMAKQEYSRKKLEIFLRTVQNDR